MIKEKVLDRVIVDAKISERRILILPIATIRHTPYNPPARTKAGRKLDQTIESIRAHGLQYPILITDDRTVIDGNRRLTACRILGHETIECIVCSADPDTVFNEVNTAVEPMGRKGWLVIGRSGRKLPANEAVMYQELHDRIGNYGIDKLIACGIGLNILQLCKGLISLGLARSLEEVILTVAEHRLTNKVNAIKRADMPAPQKVAALTALLDSCK